jgi:hypothetical protein
MSTARFVLLWWLALFGWWIVLAGTNDGPKLIAGACAALLAALLVALLRRQGFLKALDVPWKVVREIGAVFGALALHVAGQRHLSSRYRSFDSPSADADSEEPVTRPSGPRPRG